jgi:hypothetical protein
MPKNAGSQSYRKAVQSSYYSSCPWLVPQKVCGTSRVNGVLSVGLTEYHGLSRGMSHGISHRENGSLFAPSLSDPRRHTWIWVESQGGGVGGVVSYFDGFSRAYVVKIRSAHSAAGL